MKAIGTVSAVTATLRAMFRADPALQQFILARLDAAAPTLPQGAWIQVEIETTKLDVLLRIRPVDASLLRTEATSKAID